MDTLLLRQTRTTSRWDLGLPLIRRAVLMLLMSFAPSVASAQTYHSLGTNGTITFGAWSFTIAGCTYELNNGGYGGCSSDNIEVDLTSSNGAVTLTYDNTSNPASALFSQATANGCTCIMYEITVANSIGVSKALLSTTGIGKSGASLDNWLETYSSWNGGNYTRLAEAQITTAGSHTVTSSYYPAGDPTSLNLELGLGVNSAYQAGTFSLNSASVTFTQVPEPASILVLLTGIGGLLFVRSRARRGLNGATPLGAPTGHDEAAARMG